LELGVLVNFALFMAGLSVDDSIHVFKALASKAFEPRRVSGIPVISDIEKIILSFLADSLYPSEGLEAGLKEVFGDTMTMFDCTYAAAIGAKVAATVTTIPGSHPCLFRNYKKLGKRHEDCGTSATGDCNTVHLTDQTGYHIIQPQDGHNNPRVWEMYVSLFAVRWVLAN
jgi:hypothetical protein